MYACIRSLLKQYIQFQLEVQTVVCGFSQLDTQSCCELPQTLQLANQIGKSCVCTGYTQALGLGGSMVSSLVEELVKEGSVQGLLKGGATTWTPHIYTRAQQVLPTAHVHHLGRNYAL